MYIFDLPTTGSLSFTDFLLTTDLNSHLSQTTQLRARLRAVLKENRAGTTSSISSSKQGAAVDLVNPSNSGEGGGNAVVAAPGDWLTIIKVIEEYLPQLLAIFNSVQTDDLILRYEPLFSWRTSISSTRFRGQHIRIDLPGLHYELAFTLLTYALTLSNFAASTVSSLGAYERDRNISTVERKEKDDKLRQSADTLCRCSGILIYLSQDLLPKWRDQVAGRIEGLPLDLTSEATLAVAKMCLAEAQALAIRKLVSPSLANATDTITPGPPLEKGHPSASLLGKLHLSVVEELESALGLLRTVGEKGKSTTRGGNSSGSGGSGGGRRRGGREVGLSANYEHELLHRRLSATRDLSPHDIDEDPPTSPVEGVEGGKDKSKKLFSKFKFGSNNSKERMVSGPHDAPYHSSSGRGGGSNFYAQPTSLTTGLDSDLSITPSLVKYLSFSSTFHRAMAYKWLGIDSGEVSSKIGTGIAFLSLSANLLSSTSLKDLSSGLSNISISSSSSSLLNFPSTKSKLKSERAVVEAELSTVNHWLTSYRKLNDTVSFQPVPSPAEVQNKIPAGRAALGVKEFKLPTPTWGPGSAGYKGRAAEGEDLLALDKLHLLDEDHPARKNLALAAGADEVQSRAAGGAGGYAGQGAYY